jgi:hypothetical protein
MTHDYSARLCQRKDDYAGAGSKHRNDEDQR